MNNIEYIDDYFKGSPGEQEKHEFQQRINNDHSFAEEVAFYISANHSILEHAADEKRMRFRNIYEQQKLVPAHRVPLRQMMRYMAAASLLALVILFAWLYTGQHQPAGELADQYISKNFGSLGVNMGSRDSLQSGINLYNQGNFAEAFATFSTIVKNDSTSEPAARYAGISALRLNRYDDALAYFTLLDKDTSGYSFGKLYQAITLLKRNKGGDIAAAKKILQQVVAYDLEGKQEAENLLKKL